MYKEYVLKNGKTLVIREGNIGDAENFIVYANNVGGESDFLTFNAGQFNSALDSQQKSIEELNNKENGLFLIAEISNKIAGNLTFRLGKKPKTAHAGEFGITIQKQYWNLGIGQLLIQTLIDWARCSGNVRKINLRVREDNQRGLNLYRKMGFKQEGILERDLYSNGIFYNGFMMGLCIDPDGAKKS